MSAASLHVRPARLSEFATVLSLSTEAFADERSDEHGLRRFHL